MTVDNPVGLQYLLSDDIYLLKQDMDNLTGTVAAKEEVAVAVAEPEPVKATEPSPVVAEPAPLYFSHLGSNAKQFLIVCNYAANDQMNDKHLEALKSALSRKELALNDVAIVNLAKYTNATITELNEYFKPAHLLLLGAPCLLAGWDKLVLNQLTNLGATKALYTYSFTEMMGDRDKTKAFWEQMKVL